LTQKIGVRVSGAIETALAFMIASFAAFDAIGVSPDYLPKAKERGQRSAADTASEFIAIIA
jgi:hypothetical protein